MSWWQKTGTDSHCVAPAKPMQNIFVESFTDSFRDEFLNKTLFLTMRQALEAITARQVDYNQAHPHSPLGNLTPQEFAPRSRLETQVA